jgi:hypothetical protein
LDYDKKSPDALEHPGLVSHFVFLGRRLHEKTSGSMTTPSPWTLGLGGSFGHVHDVFHVIRFSLSIHFDIFKLVKLLKEVCQANKRFEKGSLENYCKCAIINNLKFHIDPIRNH